MTQNGDGTFTFITGHRVIYTFDSSGALTKISDLNGNAVTISHAYGGALLATDSAGRTLTMTVSGGHVTSATDPVGNETDYGYDGAGNLTSVTDPVGNETDYGYDASHQMTSVTDPRDNTLTDHYDSNGRVDQQTDRRGKITTFDYDSITDATEVTNPAGDVTVDYYTDGLMTERTVGYGTADAATTSYQYDPISGGAEQVTDPNGNVTTKTYDGDGNVLTSTDPMGNTTSYTYNSFDEPTSITDPLGTATTYTYDGDGNLLSTSTPLTGGGNATSTYTYGSGTTAGDVMTSTDPDGNTTNYDYDTVGNRTSTTDPLNNETTSTYDDDGRLLSTTTPNGDTTNYLYDDDGRLSTVQDPLWSSSNPSRHETATTYDADGNVASSTDGVGHATSYSYDADGELTDTSLPNGNDVMQTWTDDGMLASVSQGSGHTTTYAYDARDERTSSTDGLGQTTSYSYDSAGNLVLQAAPGATCTGSSPSAGCTSFDYDAANQVTARHYLDGATTDVTSISYDADGRPTGQSDASGTSSASYDSLGRLASYTDGHGTTTSYGYDLAGNQTSISYPGSGHSVTNSYDADNRLASVSDWYSNTVSFGYDADSNLTTTTWPSATGEVDQAGYNDADEPILIQAVQGSTVLASYGYGYNGNNQLVSTATTGISDPAQAYAYNSVQELTQSGPTGSPTGYGYDQANDLTTRASSTGGTISQAFDDDSQLCWSSPTAVSGPACASPPSGASSYSYDPEGDRTTATPATGNATSYSYDEAQDLTSYTSPAGTTTHYTYDASGLRATSATSGSSITDHDTWDRASTVPLLLSDGPHKFIYGPGGVPIEQITTSTAAVTYLHTDQAGSVRLLTDTSGTVTGTYSYDPWGQTTAHTGTGTTPLGYDGQYTDPESGLIYLRARYYDPQTAQFLTLDPAVAVTGQPYNYTGNDPLNAADPTGLGCGVFNPGDCFHDVAHGAATAWNDTLGGHWRGVAQVATVVGTALGTAACIEATAGLCAAALPEIGGLTGMALYAESGGPHTAEGYTKAFAEGGIAGSLGLVCTAVCGLAGNVLVVSGIVNGLVGAGQGMWDYSTNGDCSHNAGGYLSSGAEGFAQGAIPWDEIWKAIH